ncbi:hypothetical protein I553_6413 [Mycobacterium xenopi 4042]|uniref:Uncharacterized protein n=1 Tax=Mycobacterium xenopi 4042 TaxID=1299334 RepID=X8BH30_MYCXE|nr:hypothetical protein I553_6413 [Mycobacterium xenopi 4042]
MIDAGITAATLEHTRAHIAVSGVDALLESQQVATEIGALASLLRRRDERLRILAADDDLGGIRTLSSYVARAFEEALARIGHRGLGRSNWPAACSATTQLPCWSPPPMLRHDNPPSRRHRRRPRYPSGWRPMPAPPASWRMTPPCGSPTNCGWCCESSVLGGFRRNSSTRSTTCTT